MRNFGRNVKKNQTLYIACGISVLLIYAIIKSYGTTVLLQDIKFLDSNGEYVSLAMLRSKFSNIPKACLIVNVATYCGYTEMNYINLQKLYEEMKGEVLVVAFPCNQFGNQEPEDVMTIIENVQRRYGVSFPIMEKIEVNGKNSHPLYKWLKSANNDGRDVEWNFVKFLVSQNGKVTKFGPQVNPMELIPLIV